MAPRSALGAGRGGRRRLGGDHLDRCRPLTAKRPGPLDPLQDVTFQFEDGATPISQRVLATTVAALHPSLVPRRIDHRLPVLVAIKLRQPKRYQLVFGIEEHQ